MAAHARLKNEFTENEKYQNLMSWLILFSYFRHRLQDEYCKQVSAVFLQWESDLEKCKEQEAKLTVSSFFYRIPVVVCSLLMSDNFFLSEVL